MAPSPPVERVSSRGPSHPAALALVIAFAGLSCTGIIGEPARAPGGPGVPPVVGANGQPTYALLHLRRLTQGEYAHAVNDLLGATHPETGMVYPSDPRTPFDNNATDQVPSEALVTGGELLATESATALMADTTRRARVVGCTPSGPADGACMRTFIRAFGRRAIRRPMDDADVERYATSALAIAAAESDFFAGAEVVVSAFLQHPRFLYRVEIGTPVATAPGVVRLDGYELAARLSFLIWGTAPDDALLDAAQRGDLATPAGVAARAATMLNDPRAADQTSRLHAMWLGYEILPHAPSLSAAMRDESSTLVKHVLMEENRPWHDLFRERGTYLNDELAANYGLPAPGSTTPTYVPYGTSGRQGILSHGSFLSHGGDAGDRTPIHRGLAVRRGLLCQTIELPSGFMPPPLAMPTTSQCRRDLLAAHEAGGCAACHGMIDPVGFGLEGFDGAGRPQATDPGRPTCTISGQGRLDSTTFQGVAGLSNLLVQDGRMAECFESQIYRYAIGRAALDPDDRTILQAMSAALGGHEFTYRALVSAIVTSPAFFYRRLPQ